MNELPLPALDGRTPLAFLAACGLLRLLDVHTDDTPRLSWSTEDFTARLHTTHASIESVIDSLESVIESIPPGAVLPGAPLNLPPPGAAPDQLRLPPAQLRMLADELAPSPMPEVDAWLGSLITDLSLDDKYRADISMLAAPSGKQSMRTMLQKPLEFVQKDRTTLTEALLGWRRRSGVSGEYLDHRVLFDSADSGSGESEERGVPGATWLALMSYPLFRTTADGKEPITTAWHRRYRLPPVFVYPLWSAALDRHTVTALLEHPILQRCVDGEMPRQASALSIFTVQRAQRRRIPGRTFAGVLGPVHG